MAKHNGDSSSNIMLQFESYEDLVGHFNNFNIKEKLGWRKRGGIIDGTLKGDELFHFVKNKKNVKWQGSCRTSTLIKLKYDGYPYLVIARQAFICHHGPDIDYNQKIKHRSEYVEKLEAKGIKVPENRSLTFSKKMNCPAVAETIYMIKLMKLRVQVNVKDKCDQGRIAQHFRRITYNAKTLEDLEQALGFRHVFLFQTTHPSKHTCRSDTSSPVSSLKTYSIGLKMDKQEILTLNENNDTSNKANERISENKFEKKKIEKCNSLLVPENKRFTENIPTPKEEQGDCMSEVLPAESQNLDAIVQIILESCDDEQDTLSDSSNSSDYELVNPTTTTDDVETSSTTISIYDAPEVLIQDCDEMIEYCTKRVTERFITKQGECDSKQTQNKLARAITSDSSLQLLNRTCTMPEEHTASSVATNTTHTIVSNCSSLEDNITSNGKFAAKETNTPLLICSSRPIQNNNIPTLAKNISNTDELPSFQTDNGDQELAKQSNSSPSDETINQYQIKTCSKRKKPLFAETETSANDVKHSDTQSAVSAKKSKSTDKSPKSKKCYEGMKLTEQCWKWQEDYNCS